MIYTRHAVERCGQRAIPEIVVELILSIGEEFDAGKGTRICALSSNTDKAEFISELKDIGLKRAEKWTKVYLVISPEKVLITAGYRYKRIREAIKKWH